MAKRTFNSRSEAREFAQQLAEDGIAHVLVSRDGLHIVEYRPPDEGGSPEPQELKKEIAELRKTIMNIKQERDGVKYEADRLADQLRDTSRDKEVLEADLAHKKYELDGLKIALQEEVFKNSTLSNRLEVAIEKILDYEKDINESVEFKIKEEKQSLNKIKSALMAEKDELDKIRKDYIEKTRSLSEQEMKIKKIERKVVERFGKIAWVEVVTNASGPKVICQRCGGDGGATGACGACDGTGWVSEIKASSELVPTFVNNE